MAAHVREGASASTVVTALVGVEAAVAADARTAHLAAAVRTLIERGDTVALAVLEATRELARKRALVTVADTSWDQTVLALGHALRGPGADPAVYRGVFTSSPSSLTELGFTKELERGEKILATLSLYPAVSETWSPRLRAAQTALRAAVEARDAALLAAHTVRGTEAVFVEHVNHAIDDLEAQLFTIFGSDRATASSFLASLRDDRPSKSASKDEPTPAS